MNLEAMAFIKPGDIDSVHVELRNLGTKGPWGTVRIGGLTFYCEPGAAQVFQHIADNVRPLDVSVAPGIPKADHCEPAGTVAVEEQG